MATIEKRGNKYRITIYKGVDSSNKRIRHRMTFTPDCHLTKKQLEKELQKQVVLFEERLSKEVLISETMPEVRIEDSSIDSSLNENTAFFEFSAIWIEDRKADIKQKTLQRYTQVLPQINKALGHLRLRDIQPIHLRKFYESLLKPNFLNSVFMCKFDFEKYMKENGLTRAQVSAESGIATSTISAIKNKKNVSYETVQKFANYMNKSADDLFVQSGKSKAMMPNSVLYYHRVISSIMSTAVQWGLIDINPCTKVKPPKAEKKQPKFLDEKQAHILLELLEDEDFAHKIMIKTLLFTGLRRGELLGLEWEDFDEKNRTLNINKSSLYLPKKGIFDDTPKNITSNRVIKLPSETVSDLQKYREWQCMRKEELGDQWKNSPKIFTSADGSPFFPDTLTKWFSMFIRAHEDVLPTITIHSLRHTNATLQIANGVPITTVAKRLGHSNATTTGSVYAHAIKTADEMASETLENILSVNCKDLNKN